MCEQPTEKKKRDREKQGAGQHSTLSKRLATVARKSLPLGRNLEQDQPQCSENSEQDPAAGSWQGHGGSGSSSSPGPQEGGVGDPATSSRSAVKRWSARAPGERVG